MEIYYIICFFIFGTIFGSFFQVVGERLPKEKSILYPPSHCSNCNQKLGPSELIPIFSYIFQKGRCKHCRCKLSILFPLFEFATGLLFALACFTFGFTIDLIIPIIFISMLLIIYVSDFKYFIISDEVLIVGGLLIILSTFIINGVSAGFSAIFHGVIAFIVMYLLKLFGDFVFKKESMGGGDIKLMFIFGLVLGAPMSILSIFIGSFIGIPLSIGILSQKKEHIIPFGPLLNTGALIILFTGLNTEILLNFLKSL